MARTRRSSTKAARRCAPAQAPTNFPWRRVASMNTPASAWQRSQLCDLPQLCRLFTAQPPTSGDTPPRSQLMGEWTAVWIFPVMGLTARKMRSFSSLAFPRWQSQQLVYHWV